MPLIPADRLTDWTPGTRTGVTDGIDRFLPPDGANFDEEDWTDVTASPYFADNTGETVCFTAVQAACNAVAHPYFPAGIYDFGGQRVVIPATASNYGVRGAAPINGVHQTTIINGGFVFGASDGWDTFSYVTISAGLTKDSTEITVSDATNFTVGKLMYIGFTDQHDEAEIEAGAVPTMSYTGWDEEEPQRRQVVKIVSKDGNDITFTPGIYHTPSKTTGIAKASVYTMNNIGFFNFKIDNSDSVIASAIETSKGNECWFYNVEITEFKNYAISLQDSLRPEVRYCNFHDRQAGGTNGSAILINTTAGFLVWDNILRNSQPVVEVNQGSCGGVFAYNLCEQDTNIFSIVTNHGPHNSHNLYEGNISLNIMSDAYFGSESEMTAHRNWFPGTNYTNGYFSYEVALKRFTYNSSFTGNVLGKNGVYLGDFTLGEPNIGNSGYDLPEINVFEGDFPVDWYTNFTATLTTRTNNTAGVMTLAGGSFRDGQTTAFFSDGAGYFQQVSGSTVLTGGSIPPNNAPAGVTTYAGGTFSFTMAGGTLPAQDTVFTIYPGLYGYQQQDAAVEGTLVNKGNYLYGSGGSAGSMSSLDGDPLPDSLFLSAKPDWFGVIDWPPFDPTSPNSSSYENIPAGYRWLNGEGPPGSGETSFDGSGSTTFTGSGSVTFA